MNRWVRSFALVMSMGFACGAFAQALKPYSPAWKYHTYHVDVDVAPDGGTTTTYETVYTILNESAIDHLRQQSISYHEHDGTLENVVAYTLKKDGTHIDIPATNVQVTANNGVDGAAPAFSDFMTRQIVYENVEVGDSIVLSYTLKNVKPTFPGYYSLLTWFHDTYIYDDATYTVTAPASLALKAKTYILAAPKVAKVGNDRRRWTWTFKNPVARDTRNDNQMFSRAWHYRELPTIELSNFTDYRQIAAAYEKEAGKLAAPSERIRKLSAEIVGGTTDKRERAEKIYAWVAKEIRFAGNCLTGGDVVPRSTDLVLNMKMGDCKDHTTLMQALLASQDIASTPVLVGTQNMGYELPEVPCWQAFNHVFNYLPEFGVYADATSTFNPFGTLPDGDRGKPVIHTAVYDGIRKTPARTFSDNVTLSRDTLKIASDGSLDASTHVKLSGDPANSTSKRFLDWMKSPEFDNGAQYFRQSFESMGYAGEGRYSELPELDGPSDSFAMTMIYSIHDYYDTADPHGVDLSGVFPGGSSVYEAAQYAAAKKPDYDFYCSGDTRTQEIAMTFPSNVKLLAVPRDVHATTASVSFDATYTRDGNTINVKRQLVDRSPAPICSPDIAAQYATIGAAVKKDAKAQAVYAPAD
jgi:transglutaminase-like putative cysteine protease